MFPQSGGVKDLRSVEDIKERVLHWLSLDMQVRALAERLLDRLAETVGVLPASAEHHHAELGGLSEVNELRRDGLPAFTMDQHSCHLRDDAEECPACRADVNRMRESRPCS